MKKASKEQILDENCLAAALHFKVIIRLKEINLTESYLTDKLAMCTCRNKSWWAAKIDNLKYVVSNGSYGLPGTPSARDLISIGISKWHNSPAEAEQAIIRSLKPTIEGCWVSWLLGVTLKK